MSQQAVDTARVMDWSTKLVKSAEKRVREEERAAHKEQTFVLRLRIWEAEMKVRRLEETAEEQRDKKVDHENECVDGRICWNGEQSEMQRCKNWIRDEQQRC